MDHDTSPTTRERARFGAGTLALVLLLGAALGGGAAWFLRGPAAGHDHAPRAEAPVRFTCPMHPTIVSDHAGDCPICGMALVRADELPPAGASSTEGSPPWPSTRSASSSSGCAPPR